ncbi:UNVERIFIED_CONTAM: hypothetical protein NCL1_39594 [Trichonephila clavipes]
MLMGRKGPRLIRFFEEGLIFQKYRNLSYEDTSKLMFSIYFPHKTKLLSSADEQIFKIGSTICLLRKRYMILIH